MGSEFISFGILKPIQIYMSCSLHRGTHDPHHPAGRSGYTDRTLFRTDETGKGRNLRDPGRCLGCRGSCTGIDSRNGE